ncbi:hypothetical protein PAHAL_1G201200 [Panicum hallii]|uniref:Uncharacterized protein n=1 Tax=Panicum hallii TaxID=206008 RepID=A0A2T8KVV5_9POAL|nr:hypothetical protein PAHAL_1G201200 [Panicum hallii]
MAPLRGLRRCPLVCADGGFPAALALAPRPVRGRRLPRVACPSRPGARRAAAATAGALEPRARGTSWRTRTPALRRSGRTRSAAGSPPAHRRLPRFAWASATATARRPSSSPGAWSPRRGRRRRRRAGSRGCAGTWRRCSPTAAFMLLMLPPRERGAKPSPWTSRVPLGASISSLAMWRSQPCKSYSSFYLRIDAMDNVTGANQTKAVLY